VIDIDADSGPVGLLSGIDMIETKGEDQVVFHLNTPDATFPYKLATPAAGIVPKAKYPAKAARTGFQVDGSGPYTMEPEVEDGRVVKIGFARNPAYKGQLKVLNDKVEMDLFPDAGTMGEALDEKKIHLMTRAMSPEQAHEMLVDPKEGVDLTELPGLAISYLGFNTKDPVVTKPVRQAMAQIIDRGQIAGQVYGTTAEPLYSLIPSSIAGHTNAFFNKYGEPSTAKAAKILDKAGVKTPVAFTLHYTSDHYGPATAEEFKAIQRQLNASGLFKVSVRGEEWSTYRPQQKRGDYAAYGMGWFPDFPDPDNYTAPFLDADNFLNSPYRSPEAEKVLIPQSRRAADRTAAADAYEKLQDIVADDVPVLPIWQGKQYVASRDGIAGVERSVSATSELQLWELNRPNA
ncbi:ABC transporter substrate-binding protein, partial [Streptomyces sp. NPDC059346]